MTDLEIKEFYRIMAANMAFDYLEQKYMCYSPENGPDIMRLEVKEYKNFVHVHFNAVFLSSCAYRPESYVRLEGYVSILINGGISGASVSKEYLFDVREVYKNE